MRFIYSTQETKPYPFSKLGGTLNTDNTVELTDAAYQRFLETTAGTTHRLTLFKEHTWKPLSKA